MNYQELLQKTEEEVIQFYKVHSNDNLFYHNIEHVREVLERTKRIANHYQLDDRNFYLVCAAACFHDTGYLVTDHAVHEQKSAELAGSFLTSIGVDEEAIAIIEKCIMASHMPQMPETLLEKILCDADLFNLGTDDFKEKTRQLKKEEEAFRQQKINGLDWRSETIQMLEKHQFHTDYCQLLLNAAKAENLERIKNRQEAKLNKVMASENLIPVGNDTNNLTITEESEKKNKKKNKDNIPERGIETMFRISAANNVRISAMADNKAHIMISVNTIMISVILGFMIQTISEKKYLIIPTLVLLFINLTTIVLALLATKPVIKLNEGVFTKAQVDDQSVNLLFFGTYFNSNFEDYEYGIKSVMNDRNYLYSTLTKDLFWQGKVLGKKYGLLQKAYIIFMYGLVISVLSFSFAIAFFS